MELFLHLKAAASPCGKGSGKKPFPTTRNSSSFLCPATWNGSHSILPRLEKLLSPGQATFKHMVLWICHVHDMLLWNHIGDWVSQSKLWWHRSCSFFFFLPFKPHLICLGIQKLLWIKKYYSDLDRHPLSTSGLAENHNEVLSACTIETLCSLPRGN